MTRRAPLRRRLIQSLFALPLTALLLTALLPFGAAIAATAEPVAGTDYQLIEGGHAYAPVAGKIEVVEVFAYWCHHCAAFEPQLSAWQRAQPKDVTLVRLPLAHGDDDPLAAAFFASQAVGTLARTHDATFRAIHDTHTLPRNPTVDELASFYGTLGLDAGKLGAAMRAPATLAKFAPARQYAIDSGVEGTPTLIVNGKYRVTGKSHEDALRIAGQLIARERKAKR